jgi:hypothetical protein
MFSKQQLKEGQCTPQQYWSQFVEPRNYDDVIKVTGGLDKLIEKGVESFHPHTWDLLAIYPASLQKLSEAGDEFSLSAVINVNKQAAIKLVEQHKNSQSQVD